MAKGFEPSIQHYSTDIYKPQHSLLIEEHMFLLFCAETPPHAVQEPPPLKGAIVYESHWERGQSWCYTLSHSLSCLPFFSSSHTHSPALDIYSMCETWEPEKDLRKVSTAVQHCSHVEPIVWLTRVYIWDCRYIFSMRVRACTVKEKENERRRRKLACEYYRLCVWERDIRMSAAVRDLLWEA